MGSAYNPKRVEHKVHHRWMTGNAFRPSLKRSKDKKPFSVVIPPPNVTGSLHMGHALNASMQDVLVRYRRMRGDDVVWIPGTDHAGIATQNVVERELRKEGLTRHDLGRTRFLKRVWKWKQQYGQKIRQQLMVIGASCDWSRERFTMDEDYALAVQKSFIHYAKKGLVYRGDRLVNWCPRCASSISDLEVKHEERDGTLWYIRYPIVGSKETIQVATVRPETMLGDTGVAVHPKDPKYRTLVGKRVVLPLVGREIPVVADSVVDTSVGTGAVKVTPAHDPVDWDIGERHTLPAINVVGEDGRMTSDAGDTYEGMRVEDARERVLADLKAVGAIEKEEAIRHNVAMCDRCGTHIEPLVSRQWFVNMSPLAKKAIQVVEKKKISFVPSRWRGAYLRWLEGVHDWCISRQLWWGHRIPAWYCTADETHVEFSVSCPKNCTKCGGKKFRQDPDVLDTWFSSALWPFAVFGWPKKTSDLKRFYPTSVLMTGADILTLWVVRMVFSGLEFTGNVPFQKVVMNPTVLNKKGQRMSKSLGTGVDPMELIDQYGADATRYGLLIQAQRDQQALRFDEEAVRAGRNFVNKLWNIGQYITQLNLDTTNKQHETMLDTWILGRCAHAARDIEKALEEFRFSDAVRILHMLVWDDIADWYVEASKVEGATTSPAMQEMYASVLRMAHPFLPFVTEELWMLTGENKLLACSQWVRARKRRTQKAINTFQTIVRDIRSARSMIGMPSALRFPVRIDARGSIAPLFDSISRLAHLECVEQGGVSRDWIAMPSHTGITIAFPRHEVAGCPLKDRIALFERNHEKAAEDVKAAEARIKRMGTRAPKHAVDAQKARLEESREQVREYRMALSALKKVARSV